MVLETGTRGRQTNSFSVMLPQVPWVTKKKFPAQLCGETYLIGT